MDTNSDLFGRLFKSVDDVTREGPYLYLQILFLDGSVGLFSNQRVGRNSTGTCIVVSSKTQPDGFPVPEGVTPACAPSTHVIDVMRDVSAARYVATRTPFPDTDLGWRSADGLRHIPGT